MNSSLAHPSTARVRPEEDQDAILPWLRHLSRLFPITRLLAIGAGNGTDPLTSFLRESGILPVTLVEADEACFQHLQRTTSEQATWSLCHQLVGSERGPTLFHKTSVPSENGLLAPDILADLWPRISPRETVELEAITLADVMESLPTPADWLCIDCLPALALLQTATDHLSSVKVLLARVTSQSSSPPEASMEALAAVLEAHDFRLLAFQSGRNPKTGHALFVRSPSSVSRDDIESLTTSYESRIADLDGKLADFERKLAGLEAQKTKLNIDGVISSYESTIADLEGKLADLEAQKTKLNIDGVISSYESTIAELGGILSNSIRKQTGQNQKLEELRSLLNLLLEFLSEGKRDN